MSKTKSLYPTPLELLELFAKNNLQEKFCVIPFSNMIFNPNGDIGICRQKGTKHVVGNIKNQSIEEIWNSDYLKNWRQEFLSGNISICKHEIARDSCHLSPDNYTIFPDIELSEHQEGLPLKLTANFNGQCNLKCTMCDIWMMQNGLYDEIGFWEKAEENFFPYIKEVELLSGEPFIQKDTFRLIEKISVINPDVLWSFTTNAHWKLGKKVTDALDKIKVKNIIISIDSLDELTYSEIRLGGSLKKVLATIDDLLLYEQERISQGKSSLELSLHYLVMKNNYIELPELVDFVDRKGLRLTVNNCYEPKNLSLHSMEPEDEFRVALEVLNKCDDYRARRLIRFFNGIIDDLEGPLKAELLLKLKEKLVHHK